MQNAQRWILAPLRNQRFFSLAELNTAIRGLLVELNGRQMRGFGSSRTELFDEIDRPRTAGPAHVFARWKRCACRLRLSPTAIGIPPLTA